ncbi:uncharacterized protein PV09_03537 [Verruconis gallopava]|uniref:Cytochrome P450 52A13 n=1 Tax=Verruconis gallopava TaxID=253628 RepID=A0A0D2B2Y2_9PEZI|nr:uncharacterized protein PV09_03537 [Verruconis gallopava]KIW05674.1 hypothetical protein PV09_03537 [Verruconis gallopava]
MGVVENILENVKGVVGELTPLKTAGLGFGGIVLWSYGNYYIAQYKINKLGGHAPVRRNKLPLGLDNLYEAIESNLRHQAMEIWERGFREWGHRANPYTFEAYIANQRLILTADVENIKAILATQFQDFGKGEQFNKDWHPFLGDSIFTTDGTKWHDSRQLIRPQFVKDRVADLKTFGKHCEILVPMLGGSSDGATVDAADLFFKFTLDASTDFLLGQSVDSLHEDITGFADAFNHAQHIMSMVARAGPLNWIIPRRQFNKDIKLINAFCDKYIDAALALSPEELEKTTKSDEGYTFLHALASFTRDRTVLRDQIVAVLLAGRDTTACSLSWLFYELSCYPEIVTKLRAEILRTVGPDADPTYEDLKSMKYMQHCMNETLRLYPIVPFNVRMALKDTTLPHGGGKDGNDPIGVLKDTPIGYSTLAMQRRADIYPPASSGFPDINKFVPERWETWNPKPWTYIPFNGGPRLCVGQQFALTEMAYTITKILQKYERVENRMSAPPKWKSDIVLQPAEGVQIAFYAAKS